MKMKRISTYLTLLSIFAVLSFIQLGSSETGKANPAPTTNKLRVKFAATNPELSMYTDGADVVLRSSLAVFEDYDKHKLLNLYLSNVEAVDCKGNAKDKLQDHQFVLNLLVSLPKDTLPPGWEKKFDHIVLTFKTGVGVYMKAGKFGSVTLKSVGKVIAGSVVLNDKLLQVAGNFSASVCK